MDIKDMKAKEKMKEGEALYIKMLPEGNVGVKFFDGAKWAIGRIFTCPWHKIMGFFNDLDDIKDFTIVEDENTTLKRFNKEVDGIENIYNEITEMMYNQFSKGSSIEHCKGYMLENVLDLFEKKFPDLKRITLEEYRKTHPFFKEIIKEENN